MPRSPLADPSSAGSALPSSLSISSLFLGPFGSSTWSGAAGCVFPAALKFDVWNRILYVFPSAYKFRGVFFLPGRPDGFSRARLSVSSRFPCPRCARPQVFGAGSPFVGPSVVVFQNFEELVPLCVVRQRSCGNLGFLCFPSVLKFGWTQSPVVIQRNWNQLKA